MVRHKTCVRLGVAGAGAADVFWVMAAAVLLWAAAGCTMNRLGRSRAQECDPSWRGQGREQVDRGFNLHRGQWWNYYTRGQCFLALGFYEDAEKDFARALKTRSSDTWDAHTYGMHFVDYFPHRERGIALYFRSGEAASEDARQDLLRQAIEELQTSRGQQDSSRAKFHLNQAQKARWAGSDVTPPAVSCDGLVFVNQSPAPIRVTAADEESGVTKIRVLRANREAIVEPVCELAESRIAKEIEIPVDSLDPQRAALLITAVDVVGNESAPQTMLIVKDTIAPSASISLGEDAQLPGGRIAASIVAKDNFALDRIQVGEANDVYDCHGQPSYTETIHGKPVGDTLTVQIFDRAGNATVSSVRLDRVARASPPQPPEQPWLRYALSVDQETTGDGPPVVPWRYLLEPRLYPAWNAPAARWHARSPVSLRPASGPSMGLAPRIRGMRFEFPPHVRTLGHTKETSQDFFYVDGTLYDAEDVTRITVAGDNVRGLVPHGATRLFSHKVSLADLGEGESKEIWVRAFRDWDPNRPCVEAVIKVTKVADYSLHSDARYKVVIPPFAFASATCRLSGDDPVLRTAHAKAVAALSDLQGPDKQKRFTVCDVNEVLRRVAARGVGGDLSETLSNAARSGLLRRLREQNRPSGDGDNVDIAICGELTRYCPKDGDRFEIKLWAIDVSANECIRFPGGSGDKTTRVLADVYGTTDDLAWYIELLAAKVGERIPRVHARLIDIKDKPDSAATIDRGRRDGLFNQMRLWVYEGSSQVRNGGVGRPICPAEVRRVGSSSSVIKLLSSALKGRSLDVRKTDIAITK